jgi:hypothetical protein
MGPIVISLMALCAFVVACYGWGSSAYALFYPGRDPSHAYIVTLGLAVLALMGGVLNAIHAASTLPVSICAYVGLLLGGFFIVRPGRSIELRSVLTPARLPEWAYAIVIIGSGIFLTVTLLPTSVFNFNDDFLTYLPRVVRMRETGTLGGNPFEVLGLSDLGVQAFFQGIVSTWLPIHYAYAFDTVFCFILGLWLLVEFGRSNKCTTTTIVLAMVTYVIINPQIVNLSSVYSTTALVLALLIATKILLNELQDESPSSRPALRAVPAGAILGTVVAIKFTSVFFVLPFCVVALIFVLVVYRWRGLRCITTSLIGAAIVLLAWSVTNADKLNPWAWHSLNTPLDPALTAYPSISYAFRNRNLPSLYGGTRAEYAIVILALLVSSIASLKLLLKQRTNAVHLLNVAATIGASFAFIGIAGAVNDEAALRYSLPFLIAVAPTTLIFHRSILAFSDNQYLRGLTQKGFVAVTIACFVALIAIFAPYGVQRFSRLIQIRSVISFPVNQQVIAAEAALMSDREERYTRDLQSKLPAGKTIWAWLDTPFHLDFGRNPIWHFSHNWFVAPWSLHARNAEELRQELVVRNVDYIVWQYRSNFAPSLPVLRRQLQGPEWVESRVVHQNTVNLLLALQTLATPLDTVYADDGIVLISLRPPSQARPPSQEDRPHSTLDRAVTPSMSPVDRSGR